MKRRNIIKNIIGDQICHAENLIFSNIIGQTIYFFGSHCDKWNCDEWNERCDIGCEKLKTPKIKHITICEMKFKQITTAQNTIKKRIFIGNDEISFNVNDLNENFFLSEKDAQHFLDTHKPEEIRIYHVDD